MTTGNAMTKLLPLLLCTVFRVLIVVIVQKDGNGHSSRRQRRMLTVVQVS